LLLLTLFSVDKQFNCRKINWLQRFQPCDQLQSKLVISGRQDVDNPVTYPQLILSTRFDSCCP